MFEFRFISVEGAAGLGESKISIHTKDPNAYVVGLKYELTLERR
jgi:hypothetical protein